MNIDVRGHIPEEELHAYCDNQLSLSQRSDIAEHLLGCLICRASHAEVLELGVKTKQLLAFAAPRRMARPALPVKQQPARRPLAIGWRSGAVAAVTLLAVGGWAILKPNTPAATRMNTAFVAPAVTAMTNLADSVIAPSGSSKIDMRTQALVSRLSPRPQFMIPTAAMTRRPLTEMATDIDPVESAGFETTSWEAALSAGNGKVARLDGLPIVSVRMHRPASGGRPTFVIRQQLPEGGMVSVIEGPESDVSPVNDLFESTGIAMSSPRRTRPEYFGTEAAPVRTIRMITVAGYLTVDSVEALAGKVRMQ